MREENNSIRLLIEDEVDNTIHVNDASMDYLVDDMESTISLDRMLELCKFKTTKDYVANGSSFILPNGDFVSVKDNVPSKVKTRIHRDLAYQIALKVLPEVIKTRNPDSEIDFSELSEEDCRGLMARLTDAYGFCRINSGTGEREDRFYMILPPYEKKITAAQYGSILKYLDWGVENGKRWVQIYIGDEDGDEYGTFSFSKSTPDEIVKALRMGYNRGAVIFEKLCMRESATPMIDVAYIEKTIRKAVSSVQTQKRAFEILPYLTEISMEKISDACREYNAAKDHREKNAVAIKLESLLDKFVQEFYDNSTEVTLTYNNIDFFSDKYLSGINIYDAIKKCGYEVQSEYKPSGAAFILQNGELLNVKENVGFEMHGDLALDMLFRVMKDNGVSVMSDAGAATRILEIMTDDLGIIRINSGTTGSDNRFYAVLPDFSRRPSERQFHMLAQFLDYGYRSGKEKVLVFLGDRMGVSGYLRFSEETADDMIRLLKRSYNMKQLITEGMDL